MTFEELKNRLEMLRKNVFADQNRLGQLGAGLRAGTMTEAEVRAELGHMDRALSSSPLRFEEERFEDEWQALARVLEVSEQRWRKLASNQFIIGLMALPVAVVGVLVSLLLGWQRGQGAVVVGTLLVSCLAAVATHSFLVLRVHQQAGLAAERLSEKRVAVVFLRLAASRQDAAQASQLLKAGTAMFLGHHASKAIPLQANDLVKATKALRS